MPFIHEFRLHQFERVHEKGKSPIKLLLLKPQDRYEYDGKLHYELWSAESSVVYFVFNPQCLAIDMLRVAYLVSFHDRDIVNGLYDIFYVTETFSKNSCWAKATGNTISAYIKKEKVKENE